VYRKDAAFFNEVVKPYIKVRAALRFHGGSTKIGILMFAREILHVEQTLQNVHGRLPLGRKSGSVYDIVEIRRSQHGGKVFTGEKGPSN
jgi:hypothetical protein